MLDFFQQFFFVTLGGSKVTLRIIPSPRINQSTNRVRNKSLRYIGELFSVFGEFKVNNQQSGDNKS